MTIGDDEQVLDAAEAFRLATANETGGDEPTGNENPEQEGKPETDEAEDPEAEAEGETESTEEGEAEESQVRDPKTGKFAAKGDGKRGIPSGRLREESEGRRRAEAERDDARKTNEALTQRLADFERQLTALRTPAPKREEPAEPDAYTDPQGFRDAGIRRAVTPLEQRLEDQRLATSEMLARDKFGDEAVDGAFKALDDAMRTNPQAARFDHQRIMSARHPYAELVKWHKAQTVAKEIGDDPAAYEKRVREKLAKDPEFVKSVIEASRTEAQQRTGQSRSTNIELPPSLNSRAGTGGNSDRGLPENPGELLNSFFS